MPDIFVSNNSNIAQPITPPTQVAEKAVVEPNPDPNAQNKLHLLTNYCINPLIEFKDLEADDRIILFLRRHFITNFLWILEGIILIFIPLAVLMLVSLSGIDLSFIPLNFAMFSLLFYYLLVFQFFFLNFLNWFFNISLVTQQKVIDIDFKILFSKNVASTKLGQVEDVSLNEVGLLRAIFDYGDVLVQTAGTEDNFDFEGVPHPERVVHIIGDLIGEEQHV